MLILHTPNLADTNIAHGFFGRTGGVSTGIFESLNCGPGSGDTHEAIGENRRRVADRLGGELATLYQIHSPKAVTVTEMWDMEDRPQADAMATAIPGIALGILTADCAPILFADAQARVIGAAHAGWKGALFGVVESALEEMEKLGARRGRIAAAIGPCISQKNYEVGAEFRDAFLRHDSANSRFFIASERPAHFRFNLENYVVHRLRHAGVSDATGLSACTYVREADFFSYRRTTHRGESDYGRQVSAIVLTP